VLLDSQVSSIAARLLSRANATIDDLTAKNSGVVNGLIGRFTGNTATVQHSIGALNNILQQMPAWVQRGRDLAAAEVTDPTSDDKSSVVAWQGAGRAFEDAIGEIDGYGSDSTLSGVIGQAATQTAADLNLPTSPAAAIKDLEIALAVVAVVVVGVVAWKLS
jgi:hypothetical protein